MHIPMLAPEPHLLMTIALEQDLVLMQILQRKLGLSKNPVREL